MDMDTDKATKNSFSASSTIVPPVDKFLFISESCLPVTTLEKAVSALFSSSEKPKATAKTTLAAGTATTITTRNITAATTTITEETAAVDTTVADTRPAATIVNPYDVSWVNASSYNTPGIARNKYEADQFNFIHWMIPPDRRWKADQWLVLSRPHAAAVLNIDHEQQQQHPGHQLFFSRRNVSFPRIALWKSCFSTMYFPTALGRLGILPTPDNDHAR
jgi:hypothetical protein